MVELAVNLVICVSSTPLMLYWSVRCWQIQWHSRAELERLLHADERRLRALFPASL